MSWRPNAHQHDTVLVSAEGSFKAPLAVYPPLMICRDVMRWPSCRLARSLRSGGE